MPSCSDAWPSFALSVTASTAFGSASMTVTGICCPCSLKIWVMPSFLPIIPIISKSSAESLPESAVGLWRSSLERVGDRPRKLLLLDLDLDVHAGRKIQLGQ